ncbi:asparaginyl-tRNA synthetase [Tilletia horrida]|nr:asparaginyl-tRNA synthetase [Tilletia horrida]
MFVRRSAGRALASVASKAVAPSPHRCCPRCTPILALAQAETPAIGRTRYHQTSALQSQSSSVDEAGAKSEAQDEQEDLPWFMQRQEDFTQAEQERTVTPEPSTPSVPPAHLARTPQLQNLHSLLSNTPLSTLIANKDDIQPFSPEDGVPSSSQQEPIIFLPTAAIAAALPPHEASGVAYSDWIVLIHAKTSAGGTLGRIALQIGEFLKRTPPPASRARSHLERASLSSASSHLGGDLFGTLENNAVKASQEEFAEVVIALEAWTRAHQLPSFFAQQQQTDTLFPDTEDASTADLIRTSLPALSPLSSLRSARVRRTYRPAPIRTTNDASSTETTSAAVRGPRPAGWSRIEWEAGRRLPDWGIQKEALRRKLLTRAGSDADARAAQSHRAQAKPFWRPGKILSRSAQDGIRTLHAYDPKERFSVPELSRAFGISVESVRRILRAGGRWQSQKDEDEDADEEGGSLLAGQGRDDAEMDMPTRRPPSWVTQATQAGEGTAAETIEQRQERRARERRAERVKMIIERISRERAAMDDADDAELQQSESIRSDRDPDTPTFWDREEYEVERLRRRLAGAQQGKDSEKPADLRDEEVISEENAEQESQPSELWNQPVHYEGLSAAQSATLASSSSRPAFKSSRSALPSRSARTAKGDGDGNWVVIDAGWCVVHVFSEKGWDQYGGNGGIGDVWREWLGAVEREQGWSGAESSRPDGKGSLAKAFGLGEKIRKAMQVPGPAFPQRRGF